MLKAKTSIYRITGMLTAVFLTILSSAQIRLPRLVSDGMVIQRDEKVNVWGWASAGEEIQVLFKGKAYETVADCEGNWLIKMKEEPVGGPYQMEIIGKNRIVLNNILVGDVWVCSGQSNMDFKMSCIQEKYAAEIKTSANRKIRQFNVETVYDFNERRSDVKTDGWKCANPYDVQDFTAVGYFFARHLNEKYQVPIGLILSSKGGTPVESWMSKEALADFPGYFEEAKKWKDTDKVREIIKEDRKRSSEWYDRSNREDLGLKNEKLQWFSNDVDFSDWEEMTVPGYWDDQRTGQVDGVVWCKKEITLPELVANKSASLSLGCIADNNQTYINGIKVGQTKSRYLPSKYDIPINMLKEGKNIITVRILNLYKKGGFIKDKPYYLTVEKDTVNLEGTWKYNVGAALPEFDRGTNFSYKPLGLFNGMISPLLNFTIKGVIWYQGESNTKRASEYQTLFSTMITDWRKKWGQGDFPFLYVQLAGFMKTSDEPGESEWAELREAQLKTLAVPKTGMAVTLDIGEWNDIHPKNKKDVGERLSLIAQKLAYGKNKLVCYGPMFKSMKIEESKIYLNFEYIGGGLKTPNGKPLRYFSIAGDDDVFRWAQARIQGGRVVLWSDQVKEPVSVRYAWADNPKGANLYNEEGLPASPFRVSKLEISK